MGSFWRGLWDKAVDLTDPDQALQNVMSGFIEANAARAALGGELESWREGQPLKLILAGYVGTRNTGADVRVEEMLRQIRALLGPENCEMSLMTVDPKWSAGYFRRTRQVELPALFPKFLYDECPKHHGVIACEGSMFKSKFANALSTMMAGALGMASVENKLSVGYGGEAGSMTPSLQSFVRRYCRDSLIICRNQPSRKILEDLDVRTDIGTDTAWTFTPAPKSTGAELLRRAGWDGQKKIVAVCPINPFWWPVKPDLMKSLVWQLTGQYEEVHYKSIYFHNDGPEVWEKYEDYLDGLAYALERLVKEKSYFPILIGMERLDRAAAERLSEKLSFKVPLFVSDDYDMYQLVSVLYNVNLLASSRYHAVVTSMPGGVPSLGVTMDERIRNIMNDRGHPELYLEVDEPNLGERLWSMMELVDRDAERISADIKKALPAQLKLMGEMGISFLDEVERVYPEFPRIDRPRRWENHLPELPWHLMEILAAS